MNKLKTIFLGSAAALVVATGAQAADPILIDDVKAPREPVYRCDITGFIELPGTDVCFKVGGFAKLVTTVNSDEWPTGEWAVGSGAAPDPNIVYDGETLTILDGFGGDNFRMAALGRLNFDARTATEYGTLRAFIEMQAVDSNAGTGGPFSLRHAFVQFGNWTFGKTWSTFHDLNSLPANSIAYTTIGDNTFRTDMIRYTQAFGAGFSASIAIEDARNRPEAVGSGIFAGPGLAPFSTPPFPVTDPEAFYDDQEFPAVVAALKTEGAWGSAHLGGVLTQNDYVAVGFGADIGDVTVIREFDVDDDLGWGVNFGLVLNAPMFGPDDNFVFQTTYTDGAGSYHGGFASHAIGLCADAVSLCITDSVEAWSFLVGFEHFWTPTVSSGFGGGYMNVDYGSGTGFTYDADLEETFLSSAEFEAWDLWANIKWSPVPNFSMLLEGRYANVDYGYDIAIPVADDEFYRIDGDSDAWSVALEVTRSF